MYDSGSWWSTAALPASANDHLLVSSIPARLRISSAQTARQTNSAEKRASDSSKTVLHETWSGLEAQLEGAMGAAATAAETLSGQTFSTVHVGSCVA